MDTPQQHSILQQAAKPHRRCSHFTHQRGNFLIVTQFVAPIILFVAVFSNLNSATGDDDSILFTAPGFDHIGQPKQATGDNVAHVTIITQDQETGKQTPCRINVVGPDGHFYQPTHNYLSPFGLTGKWPKNGKGNREGKAPYRYFGRFFYSWGKIKVDVPVGTSRIEVWKGFEHAPVSVPFQTRQGENHEVTIELKRTLKMPELGYHSGDPHIHITQEQQQDEQLILDLMEAEGIRHGTILAYNEPAGPYSGLMKTMDMPQRQLGTASVRTRNGFNIVSGQEYRSSTFGHLNLYFLDELVFPNEKFNANDQIAYGLVARQAREKGGYSIYAHGGYAQEIYADIVQADVDAVELLQFGVYRGMGLADWYHVLNTGYQFPMVGACDFPACRKLGDCKTYVYSPQTPSIKEYMAGATTGKSFVTTGPMLLLTVNDQKPGSVINIKEGQPTKLTVNIRVSSAVAPVTDFQLIVNGLVHTKKQLSPADLDNGKWFDWEITLAVDKPTWIAARAFSIAANGQPDAESHTNPVYIHQSGKRPYNQKSLDVILSRIDGEIAKHKKRSFKQKAEILAYFNDSRDLLLKLRQSKGFPAGVSPRQFAEQLRSEIGNPGARSHTEDELKSYLKPIPPLSPEQALSSFETIPGFEMQLVAAEPLVSDPISACIDENGLMYVCEMRDYPYFPQPGEEPIGTVRLLRDTNNDGQYDESHIFADKLLWAGGVTPWKGGVFVAAPPNIWYLKDTTGDFNADVRKKVYTGFGTKNQQAMLNNLKWGLDHKIYGSTAGNGGLVRTVNSPETPPVLVNGQDFRFSPTSEQFEAITGTIQFGNTTDDWGNRFLCSESSPLHHAVLPQHYLTRNPHQRTPTAINNIAGHSVPIYRISPIERWRQIRSSRRVAHQERKATSAGASHHVVDAAAGVTIYRGGTFPPEYYGNVFIGDAQNNLIHRRTLKPDGVTFTSHRVDNNTEFARSPDNWFRPVNFLNTPDGTLYALDMSREILESIHIPLDVVKHLDLKSGRKHGRVYRIAPKDFHSPKIDFQHAFRDDNLVSLLESPHSWWRDTAHRLIYERQSSSHIAPLKQLLRSSVEPESRLLALWSLEGLNAIAEDDLLVALNDQQPEVRKHAVRLSESRIGKSETLLNAVINLSIDDSIIVRMQVAFSLGETDSPSAANGLINVIRKDCNDRWVRAAALSSGSKQADTIVLGLLETDRFSEQPQGASFLSELAKLVGSRNQTNKTVAFLQTLIEHPYLADKPNEKSLFINAVGTGLKQVGQFYPRNSGNKAVDDWLSLRFDNALTTASNTKANSDQRIAAIKQLAYFAIENSYEALVECLNVNEPANIQLAAIDVLAQSSSDKISESLLSQWKTFLPPVRSHALQTMLSRQKWTVQLLTAAANDDIDLIETTPLQRQTLQQHRNADIRQLAEAVFGQSSTQSKETLIAEYQTQLNELETAQSGKKLFQANCATCHKIGDSGYAVGPDLTSTSNKEPAALLTHILDPNRYVLPNFAQYVVIDDSGKTYTGLIASQSATTVTLKQEKGTTITLLRNQIDEMVATGKSLMPEGFEKKLSPAQMRDLIAFLVQSHVPSSKAIPLDVGTEPGLVEPKK